MSDIVIRPAGLQDSAALCEIYNHYIANTFITFEEDLLSESDMEQRQQNVHAAGLPWLIAEDRGAVIGYAYGNTWKERTAYRHTAEVTVYLAPTCVGRGAGSSLYQGLFAALKDSAVHIAIGGIALPNEASVALHEKMGMKKVAHFNEVGYKFGKWIDVGYWQAVL
ncbi:MAG: N-acetyltransferase family protein [Halieaceae bacterium]